jgi:two-component system chemotaxis response regulator CheB
MERVIKVLVVDDSAYVRKTIKQILSRSPWLEVVGTARDGAEALELVRELKPDVVTVDLIMPGMDGAEFTRRVMAIQPVPVVVVSIASESSERVLAALDAGAIDFVQKPTALATEKVFEISEELIAKVKAAANAPMARPHIEPAQVGIARSVVPPLTGRGLVDIVVIGISTGGPQALKYLIPQLPAELPVPIAVVVHMPLGYTEMYARRLDDASALAVSEAGDGEEVRAGRVLVAPAGRHLTFKRVSGNGPVVTQLALRPLDTLHRPSVDVMFHSAADVYGSRVLGIVMTGMGSDGREGSAWSKAAGGAVVTEAEDSCVVYGMPRSVVEAGLSDAEVRLERMAEAILERL